MEHRQGSRIGSDRYLIEELVGRTKGGARQSFYHARDTLLDRPVLLMIGRPGTHNQMLLQARAEARLGAHPNVVALHDVCVDEEHPCLILSRAEGETKL